MEITSDCATDIEGLHVHRYASAELFFASETCDYYLA